MYKTLLLISGIVTGIFSAIILFEVFYNIYNYLNNNYVFSKISISTDIVNFIASIIYAYASFGFIKQSPKTKKILLFNTLFISVYYIFLTIYLKNMISVEYLNLKTYVFRISYSAFLTFIAWNFIMKLENEPN